MSINVSQQILAAPPDINKDNEVKRQLTYVSYHAVESTPGADQVYSAILIYDLQTHKRHNLYEIKEAIGGLNWSPDGKYLLFVSNPRQFRTRIHVIDATGHVVYTGSSDTDDRAVWSSDSQYIAFQSYRQKSWEIMTMKFDGTEQRQLTNNTYEDYLPSWSPDGKEIVYWSRRDNDNGEIYVISATGLNNRRLTLNLFIDNSSVWSKDGKSIYFISERNSCGSCNESWGVFAMDSRGTNQRSIAEMNVEDWFWNNPPRMSPDGTKLTFTPKGKGMYIVNSDGTDLRVLDSNPYSLEPMWSPDNQYIAYESDVNGYTVVNIIKSDSSGKQQVPTDPNDFAGSPAWIP
ncbi:MAG: hypothetical protein ABI947_13545 [Chloroflexota bacterium]